jgi:ribosomal protein S18 acetylase RimI-like enzyme
VQDLTITIEDPQHLPEKGDLVLGYDLIKISAMIGGKEIGNLIVYVVTEASVRLCILNSRYVQPEVIGTAYAGWIEVDPSFRRQGVASALYLAAGRHLCDTPATFARKVR